MSIAAISNVLADRSFVGPHRLLMLAVANGGGRASIASICKWVNCDEREARLIIADLIDSDDVEYLTDALTLEENEDVVVSHWLTSVSYETAPRKATRGRAAIPKDVLEFVRERDGETCRYCGDTDGPFHIDHILPVSRGGKNTVDNLTVSCAKCNLSKGAKTIDEWRGFQ